MAPPREYALGLTGYPLGHSLSPRLHAAALRCARLEGSYRLYPVPPDEPEGLEMLVNRLRSGELHGLNVTIPHKQAVMRFLDEVTPEARAIGAANCLWAQDGRVSGTNTDAGAFLEDAYALLRSAALLGGPRTGRALVLGAGGSARAVVYALARDGWSVALAARRVEQAEGLAADLSAALPDAAIHPILLDANTLSALQPDLLVNTTPLGMHPKVDGTPWPQGLPLPAGAAVYDLVYNPRETVLVRTARESGLRAATGLGMLIGQAAVAFELWTGSKADRKAMGEAVEE
jgi:shikimate dehydrogenase